MKGLEVLNKRTAYLKKLHEREEEAITMREQRIVRMDWDPVALEMYVNWYNKTPSITREELYKSWYGTSSYKKEMRAGSLDRFLTR